MSIILDPTGTTTKAEGFVPAARLTSLRGASLVLVDNGKQNAGVFVAELAELLKQRYGAKVVEIAKKPIATVEAPPELIDELAKTADAVIIGVGDCGSCSAASVADGVALERLGKPTAVVCTESFKATADAMASLKGATGYRYATCAHPMAGLPAAEVHERAASVLDEVSSLLT